MLLTGAAREAAIKSLKAPKVKPRPISRGSLPRAWKSGAKRFFQPIDEIEKPNQIITPGAVVQKTRAKYRTSKNTSGLRTYVLRLDDMSAKRAEKLTEEEIRELAAARGKTFDRVLAVVALRGKPIGRTPAKGDPVRKAIARKTLVPTRKRKRFKTKR